MLCGAPVLPANTLNNGTVTSVDGGAQTSVSVFAGKTGAPQSLAIGSKI